MLTPLIRTGVGAWGAVTGLWDATKSIVSYALLSQSANDGDAAAQEKINQSVTQLATLVSSPGAFEQALRSLSQNQLTTLATALSQGDGYTVGKILAEVPANVVANIALPAVAAKAAAKVAEAAKAADAAAEAANAAAKVDGVAGANSTAGMVDGGGSALNTPKTIPYQPSGSVVLQGNAPVCGPACAAMTITDNTGASVSLENAIGSFQNGIRPTGVSTTELSNVISNAGVANTVSTTMLPGELNQALSNGQTVIVNVNSHFFIVDGMTAVDGVPYYMTRDPLAGPRGVLASVLDNAMKTGVNAIVIGK